ncbi:MAG TPA: hypothetical protein VL098_05405 [Flavipsychrobacter sp.]|nr:hypothetical protein [Flavipsychrobacter sp.]
MKKRSYKITFDLKEGYGPEGKVHTLAEATGVVEGWMSKRIKSSQPTISCFLQEGQLIFPTIGAHKAQYPVTVTPSVVLTGELATPEDAKRTDEEVTDTLHDLARTIKHRLKQQSVYIIYQDQNFCV